MTIATVNLKLTSKADLSAERGIYFRTYQVSFLSRKTLS